VRPRRQRAPRRIELVAFDLDGTLIDSRQDLTDTVNRLLAERGGVPFAAERVAGMIGSGARVLVERAFDAAGLDRPTRDDHRRFLALYETRLLRHTRPYDRVIELLDVLGRATRRLVVLTNKPLAPSLRILDGLSLSRHFGAVVGGDGPDGRKPDPAALRRLIAEAGTDAAGTLLVGDSKVDLDTARNAGVAICLARFGFGFQSLGSTPLTESEHVVDHPAEIVDVIAQLERSA
jgi:phosphoglycolate phosphatase